MAAANSLCAFALSAFSAAADLPGSEAATGMVRWLSRQLKEPRPLEAALNRSRDQVWSAIELGLTGYTRQSVWQHVQDKVFNDAAQRNIGGELQLFFRSALDPITTVNRDFPYACLNELKHARERGVLADEPESALVARIKPQQVLIDRHEQALLELSNALKPDYPQLSRLTEVRLPPQNHYLLVSLTRYFFQKEVAQDPELCNSLMRENLDRVLTAHIEHGERLDALHWTVSKHQLWLEQTLGVIHDAVQALDAHVRTSFDQSHRNDAEIRKKLDELGRMVEVLASSRQAVTTDKLTPPRSPRPPKHTDSSYTASTVKPDSAARLFGPGAPEKNATAALDGVWSDEKKIAATPTFDAHEQSESFASNNNSQASLNHHLFNDNPLDRNSKSTKDHDDLERVKGVPPADKPSPKTTEPPFQSTADAPKKPDLKGIWASESRVDDKNVTSSKTQPAQLADKKLWK